MNGVRHDSATIPTLVARRVDENTIYKPPTQSKSQHISQLYHHTQMDNHMRAIVCSDRSGGRQLPLLPNVALIKLAKAHSLFRRNLKEAPSTALYHRIQVTIKLLCVLVWGRLDWERAEHAAECEELPELSEEELEDKCRAQLYEELAAELSVDAVSDIRVVDPDLAAVVLESLQMPEDV